MRTLLEIFQDTKETLCRYDYYIHTQKRILHLANSEIKIPHLMGMQYLGKPNQFTGDFGAYAIKKQRITMESVEKLVRKYYKTEEKQRRMLEMIHRKLDNLGELGEMFSSYSKLYLYEKEKNKESEFQSDYLLVHETGKKILHLGLVRSERSKGIYHCNSFMTTYQNDRSHIPEQGSGTKGAGWHRKNACSRRNTGRWQTYKVYSPSEQEIRHIPHGRYAK